VQFKKLFESYDTVSQPQELTMTLQYYNYHTNMSTRRIFSSSGNSTLPSHDMLFLHNTHRQRDVHILTELVCEDY